MNPLAVDYPPFDTDCNAYPHPTTTTMGDYLFTLCTIPDGWEPVVVSQPARGTVTLFGIQGWQYTLTDPPASNLTDTFTYRLTDGAGNYSNTATVSVLLCVET